MKKFIIVLLFFSIKLIGQDASGAIAASSATAAMSTMDNGSHKTYSLKSTKKVYILNDEIRVNNTFVKYNNKEYQVYKEGKALYFYVNKKRKYFKTN